MQVGPSPAEESLVSLPLSKAAADADPAWYDHYCFIGMGDHYFQFDYTPDQDCQAVLPLQVTRSLDVSMKFRETSQYLEKVPMGRKLHSHFRIYKKLQ